MIKLQKPTLHDCNGSANALIFLLHYRIKLCSVSMDFLGHTAPFLPKVASDKRAWICFGIHNQVDGARAGSKCEINEVVPQSLRVDISPDFSSLPLQLLDRRLQALNCRAKAVHRWTYLHRVEVKPLKSFSNNRAIRRDLLNKDSLVIESGRSHAQAIDQAVIILPNKLVQLGFDGRKCLVSSEESNTPCDQCSPGTDNGPNKPQPVCSAALACESNPRSYPDGQSEKRDAHSRKKTDNGRLEARKFVHTRNLPLVRFRVERVAA